MDVRDMLISMVRTIVPLIAGFILTLAARAGIDISGELATMFTYTIVTGVYYALIRILEVKFPWFGILLGWKAEVKYADTSRS